MICAVSRRIAGELVEALAEFPPRVGGKLINHVVFDLLLLDELPRGHHLSLVVHITKGQMLPEICTFVSVCLVPLLEVEQFLAGEKSLALLRRLLVPSEVEVFVLVGRGPEPLGYFHGSKHLELVILDDFSVSLVILVAMVHVVLLVLEDLSGAEEAWSGVAVFGLQVVAVFGDLGVLVLDDLLLNVHSNFKL